MRYQRGPRSVLDPLEVIWLGMAYGLDEIRPPAVYPYVPDRHESAAEARNRRAAEREAGAVEKLRRHDA